MIGPVILWLLGVLAGTAFLALFVWPWVFLYEVLTGQRSLVGTVSGAVAWVREEIRLMRARKGWW